VFDDDSIDRITMASFPIFDDPSAHFLGDDDCLDEFFGLWQTADLVNGYSVEELSSTMPVAPPSISAWKDMDCSEDNVFCTVDSARFAMFQQASKEIDFVLNKLESIGILEDNQDEDVMLPSTVFERLVDHVFGPNSDIFNCFEQAMPELQGNHDKFAKFLGTFFYACALDLSLEDLYKDDDIIRTGILADKEDYKILWATIADCGIPADRGDGTINNRRGVKPFWRVFEEDALSKMLRDLFVKEFLGKMINVIDDDKMHFETKDGFGGPKISRHIRDNCRGFVCH
jgi:hypothetical protein